MTTIGRGAAFAPARLAGILVGCLALAFAIPGCKSSNGVAPRTIQTLRLVASYTLDLAEPSDLTIDDTGNRLWTVTNSPDSVVELDLAGRRVKTLPFVGHDLEGVAFDKSDKTLWLAEENRREVVHIDLNGNVLGTFALGITGEQNSGLEGICLTAAGGIYVLNEKHPGLFITLDPSIAIATIDTVKFAGDYSGMSLDPGTGAVWIVSDQSKRLYLWSRTSGVMKEYYLPFDKAEGVAYSPGADRFYIITDTGHTLYVYDNVPVD